MPTSRLEISGSWLVHDSDINDFSRRKLTKPRGEILEIN